MANNKSVIQFAQSLANLAGANIAVDGVFGPATSKAISVMPPLVMKNADATLKTVGLPPLSTLATPVSQKSSDWDALVKAAHEILPAYNLSPRFAIAQWALESGWGKSVPQFGGRSTYNFGGIKANSVHQYQGPITRTTENDGTGKVIKTTAMWAVFESVEHFVESYAHYLLLGPSSYRYRPPYNTVGDIKNAKSMTEFASILKDGGYATDDEYVSKMASVDRSVVKRNLA